MTSVVYPKLIRGFCNPKSLRRWEIGVRARLPDHYKQRKIRIAKAIMNGADTPVHYEKEPGLWKEGHHPDTVLPVQNRPIPLIFPAEADQGLWGGEGIIKGYVQRRHRAARAPKIWVPHFREAILYSEILDKHLKITVTDRAWQLIDDAFGLDSYILQTPEEDLNSNLALKLKQRMLEALMDKSLYPNDAEKREKIYNKYKKYITYSREEVEWLGLSEEEAIEKQEELEKQRSKPRPLKEIFTEELIAKLKIGEQ
ncbi:mRpL28 [Bugula neritina]|uniref:Large ribosomal subunit protein bL28m n=1 Tax=Bugula neritina TaxID=10212 RepID=A0A7J7KL26_BUGNE|nr:mRpL28 [Bugula neritina]